MIARSHEDALHPLARRLKTALASHDLLALVLVLKQLGDDKDIHMSLEPDYYEEPLIFALNNKCPSIIIKTLLDAGSNPNATDVFGNSALMCAVQTGDLEAVKTLVTAGACPEYTNCGDYGQMDCFSVPMDGTIKKYLIDKMRSNS